MADTAETGKIIPFPQIHPVYRKGWFVKMLEKVKKPKSISTPTCCGVKRV